MRDQETYLVTMNSKGMSQKLSRTTNTSGPSTRPMPLRPQSGVVQAMKRKAEACDEDNESKKKQDTKKTLEDYVQKIFALTVQRLNAGMTSSVPPLSVLITTKFSDMIADDNEKTKRNWQFVAVGANELPRPNSRVKPLKLLEASNNKQAFNKTQVQQTIGATIEQQQRKGPIKINKRQFHAESVLLHQKCKLIGVSGGKNCIFCALYFLKEKRPYSYHKRGIKSWHLPIRASITDFFGQAVSTYVAKHKNTILDFKNCPVTALNENDAQTLIDLLCGTTKFWQEGSID